MAHYEIDDVKWRIAEMLGPAPLRTPRGCFDQGRPTLGEGWPWNRPGRVLKSFLPVKVLADPSSGFGRLNARRPHEAPVAIQIPLDILQLILGGLQSVALLAGCDAHLLFHNLNGHTCVGNAIYRVLHVTPHQCRLPTCESVGAVLSPAETVSGVLILRYQMKRR